MESSLKKELRAFPCCNGNWFGAFMWKRFRPLMGWLVLNTNFGWKVIRKLTVCRRPSVACTWYGGKEQSERVSQVWCEKHIPEPHTNYMGEPLVVERLDE